LAKFSTAALRVDFSTESGTSEKQLWQTMAIIINLVLLALIAFQWAFISYLIAKQHQQVIPVASFSKPLLQVIGKPLHGKQTNASLDTQYESPHSANQRKIQYEGVAVTLMINSPKWFQRRYTSMVANILDNTPQSWAVQIFYTPQGQSQFGLDINPGIERMNATHDRLIMTRIPDDIVKEFGMKKKKLYWTSKYLWNSMVANNVFVFSGNGAICSNSNLSFLDGSAMELLRQFDFIGTPSRSRGEGGDGSISFRKKSSMLDVIQSIPHDGNAAEDHYFTKSLNQMNANGANYRIATRQETHLMGGIESPNLFPPFVISGTLANLDHEIRQVVLEMCPEVKRIFPSLHNPACFGAHPDPNACAKSICALQDPSVRGKHGC